MTLGSRLPKKALLALAAAAALGVPLFPAPASAGTENTLIVTTLYFATTSCGPATLNSYPENLCDAPAGSIRDPYGYGNRDCGSYLAWMETGGAPATHVMLPYSVLGTPGYWPQEVPPSWLVPWPEAGDVAIVPADPPAIPGHGLYVLGNNWHGTGDLLVESYNEDALGTYSLQVWRPSGTIDGIPATLQFIRFPVLTAW